MIERCMMPEKKNNYSKERFTRFWERMARTYPLPFDEKTLAETQKVISLVKNQGLSFSKAHILDIGCGTGIYTLPLAAQAAQVTGMDDSDAMIGRMKGVISARGIENVQAVKASWQDMDIQESGFEKAFDIVWASMTPALRTVQDFCRMEQCAKTWCVFIGWGQKRKDALMQEVFDLHGLEFGPPPGAEAARKILESLGRTPSIDYFETSWTWSGSLADALENMACFIEMQGKTADDDQIRKVVNRHQQNGEVQHVTEVEEGIMVWQVA